MPNKEIILIGGFHEIIELCEDAGYKIIGIIDNTLRDEYMGYQILGTDKDAPKLFASISSIPLIISPDKPLIRKNLVVYYHSLNYKFTTLISPFVRISRSCSIGTGTIIKNDVNLSSNTTIGDFVHLNVMANVMHDSIIQNYTTIAPNAVVLGRVTVGCESYIGANSTIMPNIFVGNNAIVGAGAVVVRDVMDGSIVKGIPAK